MPEAESTLPPENCPDGISVAKLLRIGWPMEYILENYCTSEDNDSRRACLLAKAGDCSYFKRFGRDVPLTYPT